MQKAAIVILNYNGEDMLRKFLPAVTRYSLYDVFVADNGSTDGSIDFLKQNYPKIKTLLLGSNNGFAQGYNLALEQIKGIYEYYILLNSDIQVTDNWDKEMIGWLDKSPHVVVSQPKILSYQRPEYFDHAGAGGGFLDALGYPYCRGRIFNHTEKDNHQYDDRIPVDWASGACFFVRAKDFHIAGGFDKGFFAHMEEIDLCWRLRRSGKKIYYNGQVSVYHVNGGTLARNSPFKTYLNFRNNLLMLYKNLSDKAFTQVFILRLIFDFAAMMQFSLTEGFAHGKAVFKAYADFIKMKTSAERTGPLASKLTKDDQGKKIRSIVVEFYLKGKRTYSEIN